MIADLKPGKYTLVMAAPGFRAIEREIALRPEEQLTLPAIRLENGDVLHGKVVDGIEGTPVVGAKVTVIDPPGGGEAFTENDGTFQLSTGADGPVGLEVSAEEYPTAFTEAGPELFASDEPLKVELFPGGRVQVAVWEEEEDAPCGGCTVHVTLPGGRTHSLLTSREGEALSPLVAPGRYYAVLEQVESLGPMVRVSGGDNLRWATVEPGRTTHVQFGEKALPMEVLFSPTPGPEWALQAQSLSRQVRTQPGPDGSYLVKKRASEALVLALQSRGAWVFQASLAGDQVEPVLRLPLADTAVEGRLASEEALLPLQLVLLASTDGSVAAKAWTDDQGAFRVPYLRPGLYQLVVGDRALRTVQVSPGAPSDLGTIEVKR